MLSISNAYRYYLYVKIADMRKSIDGLSGIVREQYPGNPLNGDVFIFISRSRNRIKLLHWQGDGFALYYKRLEKGTYESPRVDPGQAMVKLKAQELLLIIEGISLLSVKRRPRYEHQIV